MYIHPERLDIHSSDELFSYWIHFLLNAAEPYDPGAQNIIAHGYICSNSQQYTVWVEIIVFSFMPKINRLLSKDHVS